MSVVCCLIALVLGSDRRRQGGGTLTHLRLHSQNSLDQCLYRLNVLRVRPRFHSFLELRVRVQVRVRFRFRVRVKLRVGVRVRTKIGFRGGEHRSDQRRTSSSESSKNDHFRTTRSPPSPSIAASAAWSSAAAFSASPPPYTVFTIFSNLTNKGHGSCGGTVGGLVWRVAPASGESGANEHKEREEGGN